MMSFSHEWRRAKTQSSAVMLGMRTLSVTLWKSGRWATTANHVFGVMLRQRAVVWRRNCRTKIRGAVAATRVFVGVLSTLCGLVAFVSLLMWWSTAASVRRMPVRGWVCARSRVRGRWRMRVLVLMLVLSWSMGAAGINRGFLWWRR